MPKGLDTVYPASLASLWLQRLISFLRPQRRKRERRIGQIFNLIKRQHEHRLTRESRGGQGLHDPVASDLLMDVAKLVSVGNALSFSEIVRLVEVVRPVKVKFASQSKGLRRTQLLRRRSRALI